MAMASHGTAGGKTRAELRPGLAAILSIATAVIIMNIHTTQTLVGLVAADLSVPASLLGLIGMAPLAGYAVGLIFVVPLSDVVESRLLVFVMLSVAVLAAGVAAVAWSIYAVSVSLFILGVSCSCVQIIVPVVAALAPLEYRGRAVGNAMAGLMVGVVAARPFASFSADTVGWRFVYASGSLALVGVVLVMKVCLPIAPANPRAWAYSTLVASLWNLMLTEKVLRRRAITAALMMASFSMFWSTIALQLGKAPFWFSQRDIAIFALVGAGGVLATPFARWLGDRNFTFVGTVAGHMLVALSMLISAWAGTVESWSPVTATLVLGGAAIALDVGLTADHTLGRRAINLVRPEMRGRMNGLFVGGFFLGGALGAALSGLTWSWGGWWLTSAGAAAFAVVALIVDLAWALWDGSWRPPAE